MTNKLLTFEEDCFNQFLNIDILMMFCRSAYIIKTKLNMKEKEQLDLLLHQKSATLKGLAEKLTKVICLRKSKESETPIMIIENLFIGSYTSAINQKIIEDYQITNILSCIGHLPISYANQKISCLQLNFKDSSSQNLIPPLEQAIRFIDKSLNAKQNILVHCFKGVSRSAAIVTGYLIKRLGIDSSSALNMVSEKYPLANPNKGFMNQLKDFSSMILQERRKQVIQQNQQKQLKMSILQQPNESNTVDLLQIGKSEENKFTAVESDLLQIDFNNTQTSKNQNGQSIENAKLQQIEQKQQTTNQRQNKLVATVDENGIELQEKQVQQIQEQKKNEIKENKNDVEKNIQKIEQAQQSQYQKLGVQQTPQKDSTEENFTNNTLLQEQKHCQLQKTQSLEQEINMSQHLKVESAATIKKQNQEDITDKEQCVVSSTPETIPAQNLVDIASGKQEIPDIMEQKLKIDDQKLVKTEMNHEEEEQKQTKEETEDAPKKKKKKNKKKNR